MAVPDPAPSASYRGRFAPSPTGPLHAGSVLTALASYLDARANGGVWLVRMEDLDPPRESAEAASSILHALETLGLWWDETVIYQSQRHAAYAEALRQLERDGQLFACDCSRQALGGAAVYPGRCRERALAQGRGRALRCRTPALTLAFVDRLQGAYSQDLAREVGDFVVFRRDGLHAYQLAVVVDDAWQGITDIVRGIDLLDSTPRQIHLQHLLGLPTPRYAHVPVVVNAAGQKLGKQQHAAAIDTSAPARVLIEALERLRQDVDPALAAGTPAEILRWAIARWEPQRLAGLTSIPEAAVTA